MNNLAPSNSYKEIFEAIKARVRAAQYQALQSVNQELIALYWDIGRVIAQKQQGQGWGENVVQRLSKDLQTEFPGTSGFSKQNLYYMRKFYLTYGETEKVPPLVGQIAWTHHRIILDKCKDNAEREFYMRAIAQQGWSKETLIRNITTRGYERSLDNQTNFAATLPESQRAEAILAVKDDYNFDFLHIAEEHKERELEDALVANITRLLAEMGTYFTFVGRQVKVEADDKEFFIDLVFYHRKLKALIAIDLKTTEFQPTYAGQMQFYLSALDDQIRIEGENSSIGIIICKSKSRTVVEYTLRGENRPIGVSTYNHYSSLKELPDQVAKYLPSETDLEETLG